MVGVTSSFMNFSAFFPVTQAWKQVQAKSQNTKTGAKEEGDDPLSAVSEVSLLLQSITDAKKAWLQEMESEREFKNAVRKAYGLTEKDNVMIFVVPKGQTKVKTGGVIIKPHTSPKLERLNLNITRNQRKIQELKRPAM